MRGRGVAQGPSDPWSPAARSYVPYVHLRLGTRFETGVRRQVTRAPGPPLSPSSHTPSATDDEDG